MAVNQIPTVAEERQQRAIHRQQIADWFLAHPNCDREAEPLRAITMHYMQRITECRQQGMDIRNVKRFVETGRVRKDGTPILKRVDGAFRYVPAASEPSPEKWPIPGAPFGRGETFQLTAPER